MASYETRNGRTRAVVRTPGGKLSQTFASRTQAEAWAAPLEARKERGAVVKGGRGPTVGDWWPSFIALHAEAATVAQYSWAWEKHLQATWGHVRLRAVTPTAIRAWVVALVREGDLANTSIRRVVAVLSGLFTSAVDAGELEANPVRQVKNLRALLPDAAVSEFRVLTADERRDLLDPAGACRALFIVLSETGLRYGEAVALRISDLEADMSALWVRRSARRDGTYRAGGKNGKPRRVPLSDAACNAITFALVARQVTTRANGQLGNVPTTDLIFTAPQGGPLDYSYVRRQWATRLATAGLTDPQPTIHDLRHTWFSDMAALGMDVAWLRDVGGHADVQTLNRYVHTTQAQADRAVTLLNARG